MRYQTLLYAGLLLLGSTVPGWSQDRWRYVPPDSPRILAMEWKKVLNSGWSELIRREVPPEAATVLAGINVIEGIHRVVLAGDGESRLLILEGTFDLPRLKDLAISDGAKVRMYGKVEVLFPEGDDGQTGLAAVGESTLLLGNWATITAAIDRSRRQVRTSAPPAPYDLWISTQSPSPAVAFASLGLRLEGTGLTLHGRIRTDDNAGLTLVTSGGSPLKLTQLAGTREHELSAQFATREQFAFYAGLIRRMLETGQGVSVDREPAPVDAPRSDGKIRIYGLEEGVREIPMPPPAKPAAPSKQ